VSACRAISWLLGGDAHDPLPTKKDGAIIRVRMKMDLFIDDSVYSNDLLGHLFAIWVSYLRPVPRCAFS
jgi:hypothetical protein